MYLDLQNKFAKKLQQTTLADDLFQMNFFAGVLRVKNIGKKQFAIVSLFKPANVHDQLYLLHYSKS